MKTFFDKMFLIFRYGLPVNFQGMVLQPMRKQQKRLRDTLNALYGDLDSTGFTQTEVRRHSIFILKTIITRLFMNLKYFLG